MLISLKTKYVSKASSISRNEGFSIMCTTYITDQILRTDWLFPVEALRTYRDDLLAKQAERLTQVFRAEPRQDAAEAQSSPRVLEGRKFFKNLPKIHDARIDACRREHLALKLGIPSETFELNQGFEKFATHSHLERYLMEYHHRLHVDRGSGLLSILANGQYLPWAEASRLLEIFPKHTKAPLLPWVYGPEGLQSDDMYDWSKLRPFKRTDASEWGYHYLFELVVCCGDTPHKTGDHGWVRLRTPEGDVYSVGLYRPGKRALSDNWKFPMRVKRGHLMMPDVSEFWPCDVRSLKVAITKPQFDLMVAQIELEKAQDILLFQLFQTNCVLWAKHIAQTAGIELPNTDDSIVRVLLPRCIKPIIDSCCSYLPSSVKRIAEIPIAIIFNSLQLALGAWVVDQEIQRNNGPHIKPHICSFFDIFQPTKMYLHHPYTFGNETILRIEEWRRRKIAEFEARHSSLNDQPALNFQISRIRYSLPANFSEEPST